MDYLYIGNELCELLAKAKEIKQTNTGDLLMKFSHESASHRKHWLNLGEDTPNYLNISKDEIGKISYATERRIQHFSWSCEEDIYGSHTHRFKAKVGKTLKKIFLEDVLTANDVTPQDIEIFVDQLKALTTSSDDDFSSFEVSGDFSHYDEDYTSELAMDGHGSLGESCMRYNSCQEDDYFQIYYENNVKILISWDEERRIQGRALLWKTVCGTKIMDRIYTDEHFKEETFKRWANKNGYIYKYKQGYSNKIDFYSNDDFLDNKTFCVDVGDINDYCKYPYMDTFTYAFQPDREDDATWYLTNNPKGAFEKYNAVKFLKFETTDGDRCDHRLKVCIVLHSSEDYKSVILERSVIDNGNWREEFISSQTIHPESKLFDAFKNLMTEDEFEAGVHMDVSFESFKIGEDEFDRVRRINHKGNRALVLDSECFLCRSADTYYHKSEPHLKTTDGNDWIVHEQNSTKDHRGVIIRTCDAQKVSIAGIPKIVNKRTFETIVRTFDNIDRPISECVELRMGQKMEFYYFSKIVHKKEVNMIKALSTKSFERVNFWDNITIENIHDGKVDKRRKY